MLRSIAVEVNGIANSGSTFISFARYMSWSTWLGHFRTRYPLENWSSLSGCWLAFKAGMIRRSKTSSNITRSVDRTGLAAIFKISSHMVKWPSFLGRYCNTRCPSLRQASPYLAYHIKFSWIYVHLVSTNSCGKGGGLLRIFSLTYNDLPSTQRLHMPSIF